MGTSLVVVEGGEGWSSLCGGGRKRKGGWVGGGFNVGVGGGGIPPPSPPLADLWHHLRIYNNLLSINTFRLQQASLFVVGL